MHDPSLVTAPTSASPTAGQRPKLRYQPSFDGIRGVGILAVIAAHSGRPQFGSGFYAVDLFFVLSGFLITTLLLEEFFGTGRISLRLFWQRRAARLLPALGVLCAVVLLISAVDAVHSLRPELNTNPMGTTLLGVLLSATYTSSWAQAIFHWNLGPMAHTWSLSVEEWFYLLWPLLLLLLLRRPRTLTRNLVVLAGISIVYRLVSEQLISSKFYLYFAPDQRVCQLLCGCALGAVLFEHGARVAQHRRAVAWIGGIGALAVAILMFRPITAAAAHRVVPYEHDGVVLMALATTAVVCCLVLRPELWLARLLSLRPLLWLGRRSYGLYLYHYAIILIVSPYSGPSGFVPTRSGIRSLVLMFLAAAVSYRWVEQPVMRRMRERERRVRGAGLPDQAHSQPRGRLVGTLATGEGSA